MLLYFEIFCLISVTIGIRFNAKEINANFKAVNEQFTTLQRQVNFLKNKTLQLQNSLRNRTEEYYWVEDNLNRLQRRIDEYEAAEKRGREDRETLRKISTENMRQIKITKTHLMNQINSQNNNILRRIERLEQENSAYKEYIHTVEEKLNSEIVKNKNIYARMHMMSGIIRNVNNNMTKTIHRLQNKHSWLTEYIYNKTLNEAIMYGMVNRLQLDIQSLQQHIHSLEKRNEQQERQQKQQENQWNEKATQRIVKIIKEQLLKHIQRKKQTVRPNTKTPPDTTTKTSKFYKTQSTTTTKPTKTHSTLSKNSVKTTSKQTRSSTTRSKTSSTSTKTSTTVTTHSTMPSTTTLKQAENSPKRLSTTTTTMGTTPKGPELSGDYQDTDDISGFTRELSAFRDMIRGFRLKRRWREDNQLSKVPLDNYNKQQK